MSGTNIAAVLPTARAINDCQLNEALLICFIIGRPPPSLCEINDHWNCAFVVLIIRHKKKIEYPLAAIGVLAHGSAHARPSTKPPIDTSGNLKKVRINFLAISGDSKHFLFFQQNKKIGNRPKGGSPKFLSTPNLFLL